MAKAFPLEGFGRIAIQVLFGFLVEPLPKEATFENFPCGLRRNPAHEAIIVILAPAGKARNFSLRPPSLLP